MSFLSHYRMLFRPICASGRTCQPVKFENSTCLFSSLTNKCRRNRTVNVTHVKKIYPRSEIRYSLQCYVSKSVKLFRSEDPPTSGKNHSNQRTISVEAKKYIAYTCKVCNTRNSHTFSKKAYEEGIVIVTCDGCRSRHLIADNLGWFEHVGKRNVEEILAEKGEDIRNFTTDNGAVEVTRETVKQLPKNSDTHKN